MDKRGGSRRDHAVVVGASMGGLFAARVLADAFDRVTVLERDTFPALIENRKGVPQGRHVHALLVRGREILDELLPGFSQELIDAGVPTARGLQEITFAPGGHLLPPVDLGQELLLASRPFIESHTRYRVRQLDNVEIRDGVAVSGLTATSDRDRVTGVELGRGGPQDAIEADLVVDASGRAGAALRWLDELGYQRPPQYVIDVDVHYASRNLKLPVDAVDGVKLVLLGTTATQPRGLALFAQEHRTWKLTLIGYGGSAQPSTDPERFVEEAIELAPPAVREALSAAEWLDVPVTHRFPSNLWRRYDKARSLPRGLLVFGDAMCSFNPLYGQGMTVAAKEAVELRHCLGSTSGDLAGLFFKRAARVVGHAWQLSASGDLSYPYVSGRRPLPVRVSNAYAARVLAAAAHDPVVLKAFIDVSGLVKPPGSLMRPSILARVLLPRRGRRAAPPLLAPG
jgi:2-polyprenyl-6-methoxyphenol hydroxylase-like FAD-dependent oxidoreductase